MRIITITDAVGDDVIQELRRNLGRDLKVAVKDSCIVLQHPQGQRIVIAASPALTQVRAKGGDVWMVQAALTLAIGDGDYGVESDAAKDDVNAAAARGFGESERSVR